MIPLIYSFLILSFPKFNIYLLKIVILSTHNLTFYGFIVPQYLIHITTQIFSYSTNDIFVSHKTSEGSSFQSPLFNFNVCLLFYILLFLHNKSKILNISNLVMAFLFLLFHDLAISGFLVAQYLNHIIAQYLYFINHIFVPYGI